MFSLSFSTDNATFEGDVEGEVVRILRKAADYIERGHFDFAIMDPNGNHIGVALLETDND